MKRPEIIKDKAVLAYVEYLESQLNKFTQSPYLNTYITISNQIDSFNEQLTIKEAVKKRVYDGDNYHEIEVVPGKIDLFADKDSKEFDRAWKYLLESVDLNKKLDEMRKMLSPEEQKEAERSLKEKNIGMAEKLAIKAQNA